MGFLCSFPPEMVCVCVCVCVCACVCVCVLLPEYEKRCSASEVCPECRLAGPCRVQEQRGAAGASGVQCPVSADVVLLAG